MRTLRPIPTSTTLASLTGVALATVVASCAANRSRLAAPRAPVFSSTLPQRPAACRTVSPGLLQALLDAAAPSEVLCLTPGTYLGPGRITRPVVLWGPREAVVRSDGTGTTLRVTAARSRLLGFTIDGSGARYDLDDAAVDIEANDVEIAGLRVVRAVYGILAQRAERVFLHDNTVIGIDEQALGLRGDGIRLWETRHSRVENNLVEHSRDVVVWYSPDNHVVHNTVQHGRYGTHFMYSSGNVVEDNTYLSNVVGVFVMYSHGITVRNNVVLDSSGGGGMGLGLKDSGNITVTGNQFVRDNVGIYVDGSPATQGEQDLFERNVFRFAQSAVMFHASQRGNRFVHNSFRDNADSVSVEGGGDALDTVWDGNDFDDYQGYDLDGDGVGDVAYELRSMSNELTARTPSLELLRGAPALSLIDAVSHIAPLFEPRTILVDRHPRVDALTLEPRHAHRAP